MNILVTGAKGMVGTALCNNLKNIRDGKNKTRPALDIKKSTSMIWIPPRRSWTSTARKQTSYSIWQA